MSEEKKPSAAAMRAAERMHPYVPAKPRAGRVMFEREIIAEHRNNFLLPLAAIIDAEFAPVVEALKQYTQRGHHDTCSHALSMEYPCDCGFKAGKAALEGK